MIDTVAESFSMESYLGGAVTIKIDLVVFISFIVSHMLFGLIFLPIYYSTSAYGISRWSLKLLEIGLFL